MTPVEQVRAKCNEVVALAKEKYGVDLSVVSVQFNLVGRVAGWAQVKGIRTAPQYSVRFNHEMVTRGDPKVLQDMIEDTVPHEFAHVVCYMKPQLGRNHDQGWKAVCRTLGGTGGRTHSTEVIHGKGTTYEYTTTNGHKVRVGDKHHRHIQAGNMLTWRKGKGSVHALCAYSIVGYQGQSLATPVVKVPVVQPVHTVPAVMPTATVVPPLAPRVVPPAPAPVVRVLPVAMLVGGESKAAISRRIMETGYRSGKTYEQIISEMIAANGYNRQLARATFKANAHRVNIPANWGG